MLLNRKACKAFVLRYAADTRLGWQPKRVSEQFLADLEAKVRNTITGAVSKHPSKGKTIKYLF